MLILGRRVARTAGKPWCERYELSVRSGGRRTQQKLQRFARAFSSSPVRPAVPIRCELARPTSGLLLSCQKRALRALCNCKQANFARAASLPRTSRDVRETAHASLAANRRGEPVEQQGSCRRRGLRRFSRVRGPRPWPVGEVVGGLAAMSDSLGYLAPRESLGVRHVGMPRPAHAQAPTYRLRRHLLLSYNRPFHRFGLRSRGRRLPQELV